MFNSSPTRSCNPRFLGTGRVFDIFHQILENFSWEKHVSCIILIYIIIISTDTSRDIHLCETKCNWNCKLKIAIHALTWANWASEGNRKQDPHVYCHSVHIPLLQMSHFLSVFNSSCRESTVSSWILNPSIHFGNTCIVMQSSMLDKRIKKKNISFSFSCFRQWYILSNFQ